MTDKQLLSIVVPVFDEASVIDAFYDRLKHVVDSLTALDYEIVFVDDGSTDGSYDALVRLADADPDVRIIKFSRNFGHQLAITAGLDAAQGDAVVIIDADLQDPPETIEAFVGKWLEGYDVVYGIRKKREGETRLKLLTARVFYRILRLLVKTNIPVDVGDFRLMSRRAVCQFRRLREPDRFVRGMVSWIGFRQAGVYYERERRSAGTTKYPFRKMLSFALDGVLSFSTVPLRLSTWLGFGASFLAFLYTCSVFVQKALGYTVPGWATIMVGFLFIGGVQLICLGIMGEYVGRIYNHVKGRPLYIVEDTYEKGAERNRATDSIDREANGQSRAARERQGVGQPAPGSEPGSGTKP